MKDDPSSAHPVSAATDRDLVEVGRFSEQPPAEIARALLESSGIEAYVAGAQFRSTFPLTGAVELSLQVPTEHAAEAREILEAMKVVGDGGEDEGDDEGDDGDEDEDEDEGGQGAEAAGPEPKARVRAKAGRGADGRPPQRLRRVAVVCAFVLPGGANFYARHGVIGLSLLLALAACTLSFGAIGLGIGYVLVIASDIWSGLGSVRRCNADEIASPGRQLLIGGGLWAFVAIVALIAHEANATYLGGP